MTSDGGVLDAVAEVYEWIDSQIAAHCGDGHRCDACGKCCDFESYDHRLFLTGPELVYFIAGLDGEKINKMTDGVCPYNVDGKCSVYEYRFAGCRIFNCKGDIDFQSRLSEEVIARFKGICERFDIGYRYSDLASALNSTAD